MHTEKEHIDPDELAKMGYERRDVNVKLLGRTVGVFYAFAIGSALFAAFILYGGMHVVIPGTKFGVKIDPYISKTTTQEKNDEANRVGRILPQSPNPLLQGNVTAKLDLQTMRQAEDGRLNGTGYVDEAKTKAYIPISRAMELLSERGLPKTASEAAVSKGNNMEPFGTGTVPPPARTGSEGDTTVGTPSNPVPTPSNTAPTPASPTTTGENGEIAPPANATPAQAPRTQGIAPRSVTGGPAPMPRN
ncbi:hypothetical protein EON81_00390 [bacterium]|nr:MAG: hypothetical protein EON81_00390 [bacterium]